MCACGKVAVVYDENEGEAFERLGDRRCRKPVDVLRTDVWICEGWAFNCEDAGQGNGGIFKSGWQCEIGWYVGG